MTKDIFAQYDPIEEALQEGIDPEEYIIGTYMVQLGPRMDPWYLGRAAACEQSTGTWVPVPANTPELRSKFGAKVIVSPFEYSQNLEEVADIPEDKLRRVLRTEPWLIAIVADPDGILIEIQER